MSKENQSRSNQNREKKRAEFSQPASKKVGYKSIFIIVLVAVVALAGYIAISGSGDKPTSTTVTSTAPNSAAPAAADIRIPVADIGSGKAKFFDYTTSDKRPVRFFAVKSSDGVYRAALDACDTCFHAKKGYHQEGDDMVCNNCGLRFPSAKINEVAGGCNPVGLARTLEGDSLVIKASELEKSKSYF